MTTIRVRSADGSDSDDGSTWALAKATTAGAAAIDAAGDLIALSSSHAETNASAVTLALAGTQAAPSRVISVSDASETPSSESPGASIVGTSFAITGACYFSGVSLDTTGGSIVLANGPLPQIYDNCTLKISYNNSATRISTGYQGVGVPPRVVLRNCKFSFAHNQQRIVAYNGHTVIDGGYIDAGSVALTVALIECTAGGRPGTFEINNFDASNMGSANNLVNAAYGLGKAILRNIKLPSGWTGDLTTGSIASGFRVELHNKDLLWVKGFAGSVKTDTTAYRSGGASDGTTPSSWIMVSSADAEYPMFTLVTPDVSKWNATTGTSKTVTVEIAQDASAAALTDGEIWLEVAYLSASGSPLGTYVSDSKADIFSAASDQTTSTETWTGLTSPTKQKLSVSFTPQEAGYIQARVCLAKPSTTVFIDPMLTVA